MMTFCN